MKKIYIGSDHAGFDNKIYVKIILDELKIPYDDLGVNNKEASDYPLIAKNVAREVLFKKTKGILLCGTGIGMSISANKIKGIRAALVNNEIDSELSRSHNDANILVLSGKLQKSKIKPIILAWFNTKFSNAKRHVKRISELE
jgi:ribose 5-phosphate isomerase B